MNFSSLKRILAIITKESYQIIRDPSCILIAMFLPLMLLFLYGYGMSLDIKHLKVGIVVEDSSPKVQSLIQSLSDSPYFDSRLSKDVNDFIEPLLAGHIRGIVRIPAYFTAFAEREHQAGVESVAPLQVIADGSEPNTANFVQGYVKGAYLSWLQQEAINKGGGAFPLIQLAPRYWYNEQLESRNFILPGSLAIIMALIGTLLTSLVVAREWERGTMEALMATPITTTELLIGKLIPYFILGMGSMSVCVLLIQHVYNVPFRGSWMAVEIVGASFLISALAMGLFISTVFKNQFAASQASMTAAFLPAYMLSGFIFEIMSMPDFIRWLTYLLPARYYVASLQTLFLVGDIWPLLLYNIIPMLMIGVIFFIMTAHITVKRLD